MLTNCCLFLGFTWGFFESYNSIIFWQKLHGHPSGFGEVLGFFFVGEARGALWEPCGLTEEEENLDSWNGAIGKQTWGCITETDQSIWSIFRFWWNIYPLFFQPQEERTKPVVIEQKIVFTSKVICCSSRIFCFRISKYIGSHDLKTDKKQDYRFYQRTGMGKEFHNGRWHSSQNVL